MEVNMTGATSYTGIATPTASQSLSIDSFLSLLASQLQNQDMLNPMSDTEFISQMAQFTALELQQATAQITSTQFAVSLIGKEALAVEINSQTGLMEQTSGIIEGVSLYEGTPMVQIDGKSFSVGQIMTLGNVEIPIGISDSSALRLDESSAKIEFTSSIEGQYYVKSVLKDEPVPTFDTSEEGNPFTNLEIVHNVEITGAAHDIYVVVKGKDGTISSPHKISVDAVEGYTEDDDIVTEDTLSDLEQTP